MRVILHEVTDNCQEIILTKFGQKPPSGLREIDIFSEKPTYFRKTGVFNRYFDRN